MVLADSCRGFNLATPSSSVSYRECVRNHACQEGRNFALVHAIWPCVFLSVLSLWQDSAVLEWRVSLRDCRPGPVDRCICPGCTRPMATCVMTVSVSTLLTGRCGRNCLYLNWLGNKPLAKRSFRKVVLADSCRGFNLATPSSSVSYRECVPNHACQEGRKSWLSLIGFRKSICACPCIIAPMVRSRPQAPDWNQSILTKRCKYRPDFTPFCQIDQFCLKFATFLHRLYCSDLSWLVFTEYHWFKLTLCHILS